MINIGTLLEPHCGPLRCKCCFETQKNTLVVYLPLKKRIKRRRARQDDAKMGERGSVVRWEMEVTITKPTADTKCVR